MSETHKTTHIDIYQPEDKGSEIKLTRRGKIVAAAAGVAVLAATGAGINALNPVEKTKDAVSAAADRIGDAFASDMDLDQDGKNQLPVTYVSDETIKVAVKQGEGVNDVIQRVYGIDAPEGTNQVVENNPTYSAEFNTIVEQNGGETMLHAGSVLELPKDIFRGNYSLVGEGAHIYVPPEQNQ